MHVIQNNLRTPQLAGFARQLGCKNHSYYVLLASGGIIKSIDATPGEAYQL